MIRGPEMATIRFKTRVSFRHTLPFFLGFSVFIVIGIAIFAYTREPMAWGFTAFGGVFVAGMLIKVLSPLAYYAVTDEMLVLKRSLVKKNIPLGSLECVTSVSEQDAVRVLDEYHKRLLDLERVGPGIDNLRNAPVVIKNWLGLNLQFGRVTGYVTVPMVFSNAAMRSTGGTPLKLYSRQSRTTGPFALVKLRDNQVFLLSPRDLDSFINTVSSRLTTDREPQP